MISNYPCSHLSFFRQALPLAAVLVAACGGGGGGGGNAGVAPVPPPPAPVITTYDVTLDAASVVTGSAETGSATAVVRHHVMDDKVEVAVSLANVVASSVSLRRGYAGDRGAEVYALQQGSSADEWTLGPQPFTDTDAGALLDGAMYVSVATAAHPDGALRGQVQPPHIDVHRIELSAADVPSGSNSGGSGVAWLTVDTNSSKVTVHSRLQNLPDANAGSIHRALAGMDGPVLETLAVDSISPAHWLLETKDASAALVNALADGELYLQFSTPGLADGAIRGHHVPAGMELVRTDVTDDAVVMNSAAEKAPGTLGRLMTTIDNDSLTSVLNLFAIPDTSSVELRQAPAGQNGPVIAAYSQDLNDPNRWALSALPVDGVVQANLDNRTLYVTVATPNAPDGVARGQIETAASSAPGNSSAFVVVMTDPPNATRLDDLPRNVFVTLNREPLPASVTPQAVSVDTSGQDGSFGDGNETKIVPAAVTANGNTIEISLSGIQSDDDVYRVSLLGGGAQGIVDMSGIALDGDNDGLAGGRFESAFEIERPDIAATLTNIQNQIFTPTCGTSGCHSGNNPPDGLLLTAGNAWSNIVNVNAVQSNLKRIVPGDPDNSYLVRKVQGTGIVANRMPLGAAPLSQQQIDLIREWVLDGAPDN